MPPIDSHTFIAKWRQADLKERSAYQQHFLDLCALINHPTPADLDPKGTFYTFEAGAGKLAGGDGFADVWYRGHFAWEYKGKHADLKKAYEQLLQYRESLENPPLLVVSDIDTLQIHTNFTNTVKRVTTLTLDDLATGEGLQTLRNLFHNPLAFQPAQTPQQVTEEAARHFAQLADRLRGRGEEPEKIAHFLIQLLFTLFAEDVELLPNRLLTRMAAQQRTRPDAFNRQLSSLFGEMSTGGWFGAEEIPHFDGRLFENAQAIPLDATDLALMVEVSTLDWAYIQPSIFGTLFERSLDPSKRSQLGAHYTSEEDILLIVEPVLMAPLRREWEQVKAQAFDLQKQRDAIVVKSGDRASANKRTKLTDQIGSLLMGFAERTAGVQVLDPACGSGNFLYLALRRLLDLWKEVSTLAGELGVTLLTPQPGLAPSPEQLHGIEINEYAHQLAQATIWIGYIQWLRENGFDFRKEPILRPLDNILHMDAILAWDAQGKPYEPDWPKADVIIGNPPFLGGNKIRAELGDNYVNELFTLYKERVPAFADLVCYWFEKARAKIEDNTTKRAGLLATNSIRGGANRLVLERIKQSGDIFWAIADKDWILDGAAVNVSMIGFSSILYDQKILDGKQVNHINPDLSSSVDLTNSRKLVENKGISFQGLSPKGPFDIKEDQAIIMLTAPINPNGRPNSDVVKPVVNAEDVVQNHRRMWTIDFGLMDEIDVSYYELPYEYVKKYVFPIRRNNSIKSRAEKWWRYADAGVGLRSALSGKSRFIATPIISKYRLFVWLTPPVVPNNLVNVFAREDDYFFGILQSKPHELWSLRLGTSLEDRPRYTPTTTFETFPFPWPPGKEPLGDPRVEAVAQAARELVQLRDNWLNPPGASEAELKKRTLTNLYNQRPTWLQNVHRKLDQAVFAAYGWPDDLSDEEILERLLALNLERASQASK